MKKTASFHLNARVIVFFFACSGLQATAVRAEDQPAPGTSPSPAASPAQLKASGESSEVVCEADVFFTWKKTPPLVEPGKNAQPTPAPEGLEEVKSFFSTITDHGMTEDEARRKVSDQNASVESRALERCRLLKEDQAACLTTGLKNYAKEYNLLDFNARKAVVSAITSDCAKNSGRCLSSVVSPVRCYLSAPMKTEEKAEVAVKDEKKKKK